MHARRIAPALLVLCLSFVGACQQTCYDACGDQHDECLDDPRSYDGSASCSSGPGRDACVSAVCAAANDRCIAQCHDETPN